MNLLKVVITVLVLYRLLRSSLDDYQIGSLL
jgi:hypothetical protein